MAYQVQASIKGTMANFKGGQNDESPRLMTEAFILIRLVRLWPDYSQPDWPVRCAHPTKTFVTFVRFVVKDCSSLVAALPR